MPVVADRVCISKIRTDNPARATIVVVALEIHALAAAQGLARRTTSSARCAGAGNAGLAGWADRPARAAIIVIGLEVGLATVIQIAVAVAVKALASEGTAAARANRETILA